MNRYYPGRMNSCCGFAELSNILPHKVEQTNYLNRPFISADNESYYPPSQKEFEKRLGMTLFGLDSMYRGLVVTLNERQFSLVPSLIKFGFRCVMGGKHPGTGRNIRLYVKKFPEPKPVKKSVFQRARAS